MKLIRHMNKKEYLEFESAGKKEPFSEFAKFTIKLQGYDLYYNGKKVNKYEAFATGFKDADHILAGKSAVTCKFERELEEK